jgi:methyl-accepting chemotaxis protein
MGFMDKVKGGLDKAKEGISDLAETTRLRHEISKLGDRKAELLTEIGRQVYALRAQGHGVEEVEAQCKEIDALEQQIKDKSAEIVRVNTEHSTGSPTAT